MNEWMKGWMKGWKDEWMNEWMNERMNKWMNEWYPSWISNTRHASVSNNTKPKSLKIFFFIIFKNFDLIQVPERFQEWDLTSVFEFRNKSMQRWQCSIYKGTLKDLSDLEGIIYNCLHSFSYIFLIVGSLQIKTCAFLLQENICEV